MAETISIIGDGAMGTVCATILARKGYEVTLWGYNDEQIRMWQEFRENQRFLPGVILPISIRLTADDEEAFRNAGLVISAVPCKYLRSIWQRLAKHVPAGIPLVSVSKGIENQTFLRPTQVIREVAGPRPLAAFSGPNIAYELAQGLPATATVASSDTAFTQGVQKAFSTSWFRIYTNTDIVGVELAGATKNIIAIAAGVIDGLKLGDNAKAALVTRGLVEITRLGVAMGAQSSTFSGLSGMGDLITTCISPHGRNRSFGEAIGQGKKIEEALDEIPGEVEGINTCRSVVKLARQYEVEVPIAQAVYQIVFEGKSVKQAIGDLMTRQLRAESIS
ncbi:MAG: NAD(P)-dependent glycerol-3-phosphate dehydrogenase [Sedimentisphaerales bacterium]|nr:NAD(P)-dependent glycerol-3-phosphate dehydrogenase [Sedimentisphaerales bacterium]